MIHITTPGSQYDTDKENKNRCMLPYRFFSTAVYAGSGVKGTAMSACLLVGPPLWCDHQIKTTICQKLSLTTSYPQTNIIVHTMYLMLKLVADIRCGPFCHKETNCERIPVVLSELSPGCSNDALTKRPQEDCWREVKTRVLSRWGTQLSFWQQTFKNPLTRRMDD